MKITIDKVRQLNGPFKRVLSVDGVPVAITSNKQQAEKLSDFLHGNPIDLNDRKLLRFLSVLKED